MFADDKRICRTCKYNLPVASFCSETSHRKYQCKRCHAADVLAVRQADPLRANTKAREYRRKNKDRINAQLRVIKKARYKAQPFKRQPYLQEHARVTLNHEISKGRIIKPTVCEACKQEGPRIEGHHPDYHKPLDVVWLCPPCHADLHRLMRQTRAS